MINARVVSLDHAARCVRLDPLAATCLRLPLRHRGDRPRARSSGPCRSPAWPRSAVGFKTVEEAIYLRNQVLRCLDIAESTPDAARRARALTFVFVGGGYAGVEALAELEDMARDATRYYRTISPEDLRFILVEAAPTGSCPRSARTWASTRSRELRGAASTSAWRPG